MKKSILLGVVCSALAGASAHAGLYFHDSFDGAVSDPVAGYTQGNSGDATGDVTNVSPGLTFDGLGDVSGNAARSGERWTFATASLSSPITVTDSGATGTKSFYLGYALNLPSAGSWGSALSGVALFNSVEGASREGFDVGLRQSSGDYFSVSLGGRSSGGIGATNQNSDQAIFSAGETATAGVTYFVLTKFTVNYDADDVAGEAFKAEMKIYTGGSETLDTSADPVFDSTFVSSRAWPLSNSGHAFDSIAIYSDNVSYRPIIDEIWVTDDITEIGVAIPEPRTYALAVGAIVLAAALVRRRRR